MLTLEEPPNEQAAPSSCITCGHEVENLGPLKTHFECPACEYVTALARVIARWSEPPARGE